VHDNDEVALDAVPVRGTLVGTSWQIRPDKGETVSERATFPAKPVDPVAIKLVEPGDPARAVTLVGLIDRAKSWMV
jgi:hypothetical protein